jgi:hypothetical protein
MNLKLNMKDINKILVKAHFKGKFKKKWLKNNTFFVETCLYEAVGSLPDMPSCLPHVLWGRGGSMS